MASAFILGQKAAQMIVNQKTEAYDKTIKNLIFTGIVGDTDAKIFDASCNLYAIFWPGAAG